MTDLLFPIICLTLSSLLTIYLHHQSILLTLTQILTSLKNILSSQDQKTYTQLPQHQTQEENQNQEPAPSASRQPQPNPSHPSSPLTRYFDPHTHLFKNVLDPPAPPTPTWERELRRQIEEGKGLGVWQDRMVDWLVRWGQGQAQVQAHVQSHSRVQVQEEGAV